MEIIRPGLVPGKREYRTTCTHCGCVFRFMQHEAEYCSDQRDGDYVAIDCPQEGCGYRNSVAVSHGRQR